ncbi:hypothetical protein DERF_012742 [Dermatophagoides farinae]|uniref:Uncharacterized protein n=1 Tax=Dermatophagoides farinae TaxID=6954 RepID=A0A922L3Q9_DERFA|nr:hypothetical protein DERF_012742 [Dermatophagoides farinae]
MDKDKDDSRTMNKSIEKNQLINIIATPIRYERIIYDVINNKQAIIWCMINSGESRFQNEYNSKCPLYIKI